MLPEFGVLLDELVGVFGAVIIGNNREINAEITGEHDGALGGADAGFVAIVGEADVLG